MLSDLSNRVTTIGFRGRSTVLVAGEGCNSDQEALVGATSQDMEQPTTGVIIGYPMYQSCHCAFCHGFQLGIPPRGSICPDVPRAFYERGFKSPMKHKFHVFRGPSPRDVAVVSAEHSFVGSRINGSLRGQ